MHVLTGGPILTPSGVVEAIGVEGSRIVRVGGRDELMRARVSGGEVIDLCGATLVPGLIEPHTHPDLCAQMYSWVDVSGFTHSSVSGVEAALRAEVAARQPGEWIFAFGLDPMLTGDLGVWDRHRLDLLSTEHPMMVMLQSMHTVYVNSAALRAAGIDEHTPDPPGGGYYERDPAGHPTGRVAEQPAILPFVVFGMPTPELMAQRLATQLVDYASVGITSIGIAGSFYPMSALAEVADRRLAPVRSVAYLRHEDPMLGGLRPGEGSSDFRVQGVKLWFDGSPYSGTMLLDEPYLASDLCCCTLGIPEGSVGQANFEPSELADLLSGFAADGWQVLTHAQGDRGGREILDLYHSALSRAGVLGARPSGARPGDTRSGGGTHGPRPGLPGGPGRPVQDHRWRLEHCALTTPDDLRRAFHMGVSPSFHVDHVRHYGPELSADIIGAERAERLMPIGTALECGHRVSLHADSPMYRPGPLALMETAVTRRTRLGNQLAAHEAITAAQALAAVTIDAAWQLGIDHEVGSIEVGKRADFTLLERNPLTVPSAEIADITVLDTIRDGLSTGHGAAEPTLEVGSRR